MLYVIKCWCSTICTEIFFFNAISCSYNFNDSKALIKLPHTCVHTHIIRMGWRGSTLVYALALLNDLACCFCAAVVILGWAAAAIAKQQTTLVYNNCASVYIVFYNGNHNSNNNDRELSSNTLVISHLSPALFFSASIVKCLYVCVFACVYLDNCDLLLMLSALLIFLSVHSLL